jgi:hypothetical protein
LVNEFIGHAKPARAGHDQAAASSEAPSVGNESSIPEGASGQYVRVFHNYALESFDREVKVVDD